MVKMQNANIIRPHFHVAQYVLKVPGDDIVYNVPEVEC